ncbi:MAG TPA: response regulator [Methylomirabilota bacterium]
MGIRVLVVEDHEDSREILDSVLRFLGATVFAVGDARAALTHLPAADIIVTDLVLQGEDGVWLCEQVDRQPRPIPVIALSGFTATQYPRTGRVSFARTLLKPVDPDEVARLILEVLGTGHPPEADA